jgi:hypothetical protein
MDSARGFLNHCCRVRLATRARRCGRVVPTASRVRWRGRLPVEQCRAGIETPWRREVCYLWEMGNDDEIRRLYVDNGFSQSAIARRLETYQNDIRRRLLALGLLRLRLAKRSGSGCARCGATEGVEPRKQRTRKQARFVCRTCVSRNSARYYAKNSLNVNERRRARRKLKPARAILNDSKQNDRKRGLVNDLDLDFVERAICQECTYCGERPPRMSLDRIDNSIGHTKENVVPCCVRCNLVRGNMPHAAWKLVAKGMREASEQGLFGDWCGSRVGARRKDR